MKRIGFSIVEVLVAAAVFVVSILTLFGIFPLTAKSVRQAELRLAASHLASNRLELARGQRFESLDFIPPSEVEITFRHYGQVHTQKFTVEQVVTPPRLTPAKIRNVEVVVRWKAENRDSELRLETQIASLTP